MNYIVFDLEFNQDFKTSEERKKEIYNNDALKQYLLFEIIQLGAVKLNENLDILSTFNSYVKPVMHKQLHPYVENMTNITNEQLETSSEFPDVLNSFLNFIGEDESVFCVWGYVDIRELINNMNYHDLDIHKLPHKYIDVQLQTSKKFNYSKGVRIGLKNSLELLSISNNDDFHDALADATYTAKVFKEIYTDKISPLHYQLKYKQK